MNIRQRAYSTKPSEGYDPRDPRITKLLNIFSNIKAARMLDVGCAEGSLTLLLAQAAGSKELFGVDIDEQSVAKACEKGIEAATVDLDAGGLPYEDNFFDLVYCGEVIEHLFDPDHLLDEIFRTLKPNGLCVLTTPNLSGWPNPIALLFGFQPYPTAVSPNFESVGKLGVGPEGQWGHIRVFTLRALKELLALHKFKVEKTVGCAVSIWTPFPGPLLRLIRTVDSVFALWPRFATRVIVLARKPPE